ncbi:MAG: heme peroxidase family protein [Chloroflexota bacterium]
MFGLPRFEREDLELQILAEQMADDLNTPSSLIPSGYTILGQFITHDLTLDRTLLQGDPIDPSTVENFRTPRFDLDSVYAESLTLHLEPPHDEASPARAKMEIGRSRGATFDLEDLPRYAVDNADGQAAFTAKIGDGRNDENLLVAQLHLAFLKLHNRFVDDLHDGGVAENELFEAARQWCRWCYQWIVVNDYLPRIVGQPTIDAVMAPPDGGEPRFNFALYNPPDAAHPMMPVEFSAAAFRLGHSMIRPAYRVAVDGMGVNLFPGQYAGASGFPNLGGMQPLQPSLKADWSRFFFKPPANGPDEEHDFRNFAKKIDSHLPRFLSSLPGSAVGSGPRDSVVSLALTDLRRGVKLSLPSGQRVARAVIKATGVGEELSNDKLGLTRPAWQGEAPLWFYILKEAELSTGGQQLGPVGGRIVAEVILGLLAYDRSSYVYANPPFTPERLVGPPADTKHTMADILRYAGVLD